MGSIRALILVAIACAGCSAKPMTVRQEAPQPARAVRSSSKPVAIFCQLKIESLVDQRLDPTTLGSVAGRAIHTPENQAAWLKNELRGLEVRGVDPLFDARPTAGNLPTLTADIELLNAWLNSAASSKVATVVMRFKLRRGSAVLSSKVYRGSQTDVNWNNADDEIQRGLDGAFAQVLDQAVADIRPVCKT